VYALEPGIDPGTRTLRARARAPNPNGQLLPGGFAQVELILQEIPDALLVPTTALVPSAQRTVVYVARGGRAEARPVETGVRTEDRIQIVSGLAAGDSVIATGTQGVRPNGPIRVEPQRVESL
jgi:membrane fusion protein (multidrug efflux system)